jgi:hypothetical protein
VIIPPVHAIQLEVMRGMDLFDDFERMKRELAAIAAEANAAPAAGRAVEVWDFTGYAGPLAEPVPAADEPDRAMHWFFESSHCTPALGHLVIQTIRTGQPALDGFGARLHPDTIDAHLERLRADREGWAAEYPHEVRWTIDLLDRTRPERIRRLQRVEAAPPDAGEAE